VKRGAPVSDWQASRLRDIFRDMTEFLRIGSDDLQADISAFGAALARLWLRGHSCSLVLGLARARDYAAAPHAIGVIVGPIAGRVSGAQVEIAGRSYAMEANTPPDCLHSGSEGLQAQLWEVIEHRAERVVLRCHLPDGACGLPGNRVFTVSYGIEHLCLTIEIAARSDADTLVNATSHAYWTLDDAGDLSTHRLLVNARRMVETGADLIPTGHILDLAGGAFDFSTPRDPLSGPPIDGCFCIDESADMRSILRLQSTRSGLGLLVESDQPGVVLYSGEHLPRLAAPARTSPIRPFSALAIEPQGWPDAPNQPGFPSIFLQKSSMFKSTSRFLIEIS
jgi:aldose 1-epimerase